MEKRGILLIFALLFIVIASSAYAIDSIDEVKPKITAVFSEKVVLIPPFFIRNQDTGQTFFLDLTFQQYDRTFTFVPSKSLSNGRYIFTLSASDLVGNRQSYVYEFQVFVPGTRITLVEPNSIGVANSTTFRVTVSTSMPSVCKYTGVPVSSFDDIRLKLFDVTGNISGSTLADEHSISSYSVEPDFPKDIYVACKDELGRENFESFRLYSDTSPPVLKSVFFSPSPVVEYPPEGDLLSVLNVDANEPVICRYTNDSQASYSQMDAFEGFDRDDFLAYSESNEETVFFPGDVTKQTFTYYIQCEDRARFLSIKVAKDITIDLSAGLMIHVVSPPPFSKNTSVTLNVTTNRRAYCAYKSTMAGFPAAYTDPAAGLGSSLSNLVTSHSKYIGVKQSGNYVINIRCDVPEGVGLTAMNAMIDYAFVIDTVPPSAPKVNATTPVCTNSISATFTANDTQSGIKQYIWSLGTAGKPFANGTVSTGSVVVTKDSNGSALNLSSIASYIFNVMAVDGAGNIGPVGTSNEVKFDSTGTGCDKTPPSVTVTKSDTGDYVTIQCYDNQSGCNPIGAFYNTAFEQPCNATQYYLDPTILPLFRTTIVCWDMRDKAGNQNKGSTVVSLNLTALNLTPQDACMGGIDNDEDGYGERCMLGTDCDDTDPNISVGCANGCIQDLDGDGYGIGCLKGNDCNGQDKTLTDKCLNRCISDNDGDTFGLGCSNGPDCKGDDSTLTTNCPNGCIDDNDGDGYGLNCPAGHDCNGEDRYLMTDCDSLCLQDTDGDARGFACTLGLDCNGFNPGFSQSCADGCTFDEDGDGFGFGCIKGIDCNGINYFISEGCPNACASDNDGDGYGWGCSNGADCNDTDPFINLDCAQTTDCIYDHDGDGFGLGCSLRADCDDYNLNLTGGCTSNCTFDVDCNALPDDWQLKYFNNAICNDTNWCGPDADPDGDGFTNIEEYRRSTDPLSKEEVLLPAEKPSESIDVDNDGMPDACEKMYGLNPADPFDAEKDPDLDTLSNKFECSFTDGMCANTWLNPNSKDTDSDGFDDNVELDSGTDPCDPESKPSRALLPIILIVLGLSSIMGSTGYLIYKYYYIPLVSPPLKATAAVPGPGVARPAGAPLPGVQAQARPRHLAPHRPAPIMSRQKFDEEMRKRAEERDRLLGTFGARKQIAKPAKVMEELARRPAEVRKVRIVGQPTPAQVARISKVVGEDYFGKISALTRDEADYFGRLATITKKKEVPLEEDAVSKLASISKKVGEDETRKKDLETAFRKSEVDKLEEFLGGRKPVDKFIKEYVPDKKSAFDELSGIVGERKGGFEALESLSAPKRKDVIDALSEIGSKSARESALSKMDRLSGAESKEDILKTFRQISKERNIDRNVFEVLLSYLLKSGKVDKHDVSEILFGLEEQGILSKEDVAKVFFNLGMKQ